MRAIPASGLLGVGAEEYLETGVLLRLSQIPFHPCSSIPLNYPGDIPTYRPQDMQTDYQGN